MFTMTSTYELGQDKDGDYWIVVDGKPRWSVKFYDEDEDEEDDDDDDDITPIWYEQYGPITIRSRLYLLLAYGQDPVRIMKEFIANV